MTPLGNVFTFVEIVLASLIFLYRGKKRKYFYLRFFLLFIALGVALYFFPTPEVIAGSRYYRVFRRFLTFLADILLMYVCFDIHAPRLLSLCFAGLSIAQIISIGNGMFQSIPILQDYSSTVFTRGQIFELVVQPVFLTIAFFTLGRFGKDETFYKKKNSRFDYIAIAITSITFVLSFIPYILNMTQTLLPAVYSLILYSFALIIQFSLDRVNTVLYEKKMQEYVFREKTKQYETTKETIDAINIKVHDMKHRINHLPLNEEEGKELKHLIQMYDNTVKTGNEAIDVLLMDYKLRFSKDNITYTFNGDGALLSFASEPDLYALFGNALENATEAVQKVEEDKRSIVIRLEDRGDLIIVTVINYFNGDISYNNNLPKTSKKKDIQNHGFGTKSMLLTAKKYHGGIKINTEDNIYRLNISLMKPVIKEDQ